MGGACSGDRGRRRRHSSRMVQSSTTEPLLRDNEREAVSNLLQYLEQGGWASVLASSVMFICLVTRENK